MTPDVLRRLRHELRTPVNHLIGYTELLLEDASDDSGPWGAHLQRIHDAGRGVLAPIDDVIAALRDRADTAPAIARIRPLLAEVADACELLDTEAHRRGATDAVADLAIIRNAAAQLLDLVTGPLAGPGSEAGEAEQSPNATDRPAGATENPAVILVVDDNAQNREILARRLARLGHTVEVAPGGHEALALLRSRPFDLLLLDVMMPELDGYEVLARLKADRTLRELPVIMLSALDEVAAAVRCIEMGADDYLTKPIDTVLLRARMGACLERKWLRDTEVAYLRQAAHVTGPAIIARVLTEAETDSELSDDEASLRASLVSEAERVDVPKGETLFVAGDPDDGMYVVLSGRLRIDEPDELGGPRPRGEARPGATIGELGMLTGHPRTTTVTAVRDSRLARIPHEGFERLAAAYPRLLTKTTRDVIDRLRQAFQHRPVTQPVTAFVLLPVSDGVPITRLAHRLTGALSRVGPTLLLDRERLEEVLGHDASVLVTEDGGTERVAAWLNELELRYRYIVYQADAKPSSWTRRCLRQADHVLLVGQGRSVDHECGLAREIAHSAQAAPVDLLLLQEDGTPRPIGTGEWLSRWNVRLHHHLCLGDDTGLDQVARRLTGTSLDLVLGGGGARGWAHLGVIRAFEEAGIPIDAIAGTSMGGLVAATSALGLHWQEIQDLARQWSSPRRLFDYTPPFVSFFTGRKVTEMLQDVFGDVQVEDLWGGFFCVSSSLTRAKPVIHRRGPLWKAVRATTSLPAIFPPVPEESELLIDGAYLNNLPTGLMRDLYGTGVLVAVSVSEPVEAHVETSVGPVFSGWDVLWRKLVPWAPTITAPSLAATIMRTGSLSGAYNLDASMRLADLAITPPVGRFGVLDFGAYQQIIDAGYEVACRQLEEWQRSREAEPPPLTVTRPVMLRSDA